MKKIVLAAAAASTLLFGGIDAAGAMTAGAIPLAESAPAVTLVAGGCGIGFHRGPYGGCRPNGGFRRPFFRRGYRYYR